MIRLHSDRGARASCRNFVFNSSFDFRYDSSSDTGGLTPSSVPRAQPNISFHAASPVVVRKISALIFVLAFAGLPKRAYRHTRQQPNNRYHKSFYRHLQFPSFRLCLFQQNFQARIGCVIKQTAASSVSGNQLSIRSYSTSDIGFAFSLSSDIMRHRFPARYLS